MNCRPHGPVLASTQTLCCISLKNFPVSCEHGETFASSFTHSCMWVEMGVTAGKKLSSESWRNLETLVTSCPVTQRIFTSFTVLFLIYFPPVTLGNSNYRFMCSDFSFSEVTLKYYLYFQKQVYRLILIYILYCFCNENINIKIVSLWNFLFIWLALVHFLPLC